MELIIIATVFLCEGLFIAHTGNDEYTRNVGKYIAFFAMFALASLFFINLIEIMK